MKKSLLIALTVLSLVVLLTPAALADGVAIRRVVVNFDFVAGGEVLPAGTDTICRLNGTASTDHFIVVENVDGKHRAITFAVPNIITSESANADVIFEKAGDRYYLTGVQIGGLNYTNTVPKSRVR